MLFRVRRRGPPLSDFIDNFWLYDGYSSPHAHERIFPNGTFELVFNLRDDELRIYSAADPGRYSRHSGALLSGPYNSFFITDRAEEFSVMGAHFRPGGAFPFLGLSAYELAGMHLDLATLWGWRAEETRERLAAMASVRNRFQLLESTMRSRLHDPVKHHPAVSLALEVSATTTRARSCESWRELPGSVIVDSSKSFVRKWG